MSRSNGKELTFNDLGGNPYACSPTYTPLYIAAPGCGNCTDATHMLDTGVGTTYLSPPHRLYRAWRGFLQYLHPYRP